MRLSLLHIPTPFAINDVTLYIDRLLSFSGKRLLHRPVGFPNPPAA